MTNSSNTEINGTEYKNGVFEIFIGVLTIALIHTFLIGQIYTDIEPSSLLESGSVWGKLGYALSYSIGFIISINIFRFIGFIEISIIRWMIKKI